MSPQLPDPLVGNEVNNENEVARQRSIKQLVDALVHAGQCVDDDDDDDDDDGCNFDNCRRMKQVIEHIKTCDTRSAGGCPICKQLVALCCHHARHCLKVDCAVPFCFNIKWQLMREEEGANTESGV